MLEKKIACLRKINKPEFPFPEFTGNGTGNCNNCNDKCNNYHPVLITFYVHSREEKKKHEEEIIKYEGDREY